MCIHLRKKKYFFEESFCRKEKSFSFELVKHDRVKLKPLNSDVKSLELKLHFFETRV